MDCHPYGRGEVRTTEDSPRFYITTVFYKSLFFAAIQAWINLHGETKNYDIAVSFNA